MRSTLPPPAGEEESIAGLFGRVVEDGKTVAKAEVEAAKRGLQLRLARAKSGLILAVAALVLLHLTLIAGAVMLAQALATLIGPLGSGLVVLVGGGLVSYILVRMAIARITPGFGPLPAPAGGPLRDR